MTVLLGWTGPAAAYHSVATTTFNGAGNSHDEGRDVAVDSSGNIYVTGYVKTSADGEDIWVGKYNSSLVFQASATLNGTGAPTENDWGEGIATDGTNVYVIGHVEFGTLRRIWLGKYNSSLVFISSRTVSSPVVGYERGYDIRLDGGDIYVSGHSDHSTFWEQAWLARYDANLTLISSATFNSAPVVDSDDKAWGLVVSGGNIFIAGQTETASGNIAILVAKYDSNFAFQSSITVNSISNYADAAYGIDADASGNIYITGKMEDDGASETYESLRIIKYNSSLSQLAGVEINGYPSVPGFPYTSRDEGKAIIVHDDGHVYVTDFISNNNPNSALASDNLDVWIAAYDSSLNFISSATLGGTTNYVYETGNGIAAMGPDVYRLLRRSQSSQPQRHQHGLRRPGLNFNAGPAHWFRRECAWNLQHRMVLE